MKIFIGVTDNTWYNNLCAISNLDEVNFWQPSGKRPFSILSKYEPFLFKLHSPENYIAGVGLFASSSILPLSIAWKAFGKKNGANSEDEMRRLIAKYRQTAPSAADYMIGCISLVEPHFFTKDQWIKPPTDWKPNIVQGKTYDMATGHGKKLWEQVKLRLQSEYVSSREPGEDDKRQRYGDPTTYRPRLGQGTFRMLVTDTYNRKCAVTQEKTLPALEASHIKPYSESGPHDIDNGILLRADVHSLLDHGYVTISPDYHFEVSKRIKSDFHNGGEYYKMHGRELYIPQQPDLRPAPEFIHWHNKNKFKG